MCRENTHSLENINFTAVLIGIKMPVELIPKYFLSFYYVASIFITSFDPAAAVGDRLLLSPLPCRGEEMKVRE